MELPKETRLLLCGSFGLQVLPSPQVSVCEPVPRHCLPPEDTSELWRRCEASVSLSILRSIILLLLFSFVNYKIVLINKYCPRLYLYYPQVFFFFVFLSSTTYLAFMSRSFIKVKGLMKAILLSQFSSPEWTLVQRADWASPEPGWSWLPVLEGPPQQTGAFR